MALLLAIDAGTTGIRALVISHDGVVQDVAYRPLRQSFPEPGWVEHDPNEIWELTCACLDDVSRRSGPFAALGITNQRETVVAWDRSNGAILSPALVWQDKRTAEFCAQLRQSPLGERVRSRTGLVVDPYFSATKMKWLLESGRLDGAESPAFGTVDSWILWNLTGASEGGVFATDPSNASRTMLVDLETLAYADELCEGFGIPKKCLPPLLPSCGSFGVVQAAELSALRGTPITGILGDQQAALFGQRCFDVGMAKATYGTGAFVLANAGPQPPPLVDGLLSTVAWDLGIHGGPSYALEGSAFIAGAALEWLRDELGIIKHPNELEPLAREVASSDGLSFIPAFVGLGSPWWDESARGALVGITRGSGRAQLARSVIDAMVYEVRAMTDAMSSTTGTGLSTMRVDGGAASMNLLLELQASASNLRVERPTSLESTALGAALLAGLGAGEISSLDAIRSTWECEASFEPDDDRLLADAAYATWSDALSRSRQWLSAGTLNS